MTQFRNLSLDDTLGGNSPSDYVIPSQKAIKTYVDNNSGGLPSQTGQSGKFLTTDGTNTSWDVAVKSVNNVSPVNGNVTLSIPVVEEYTSAEVDTLWNSITPSS